MDKYLTTALAVQKAHILKYGRCTYTLDELVRQAKAAERFIDTCERKEYERIGWR